MKPWLRSPGRMAIPPGSSMGALRVRSGRGPTFRTAPRGAKSGRMKHATGFTCSSRGDHQDRRVPEPLVASALSPDIPLGPACRSPLKRGVPARLLQARGTKIGTRDDLASAFISSGYGIPRVERMWIPKLQRSWVLPRSVHKMWTCESTWSGYPAMVPGLSFEVGNWNPMRSKNRRRAAS